MKSKKLSKHKELLSAEEQKIKEILDYYGCLLLDDYEDFIIALRKGEYIIGISVFPLELQKVFHYENGRLDILDVETSKYIHPRMKVQRKCMTIPKLSVEDCVGELLPFCKEYIVSRKNNLLDLSNVPPINHTELDEIWDIIKKHENDEE